MRRELALERALLALVACVIAVAGCSSGSDPSGNTSGPSEDPEPLRYSTADEVLEAFQLSDGVTCRGSFISPGRDPGETEALICRRAFVPPSEHAWQVTVWFFEEEFFAEREYRKNCRVLTAPLVIGPGGWLIWEQGQTWYGAVRDSEISLADERKPPVQVADEVASALGSEAWDDCGGVR